MFPTNEEFGVTHARHPVPELTPVEQSVVSKFPPRDPMSFVELTLGDWILHLSNRMIDARLAFHLMYYYFDLGIPDERPFASPGKRGESVEYFPDFGNDDHTKKAWFDFFADCFAYKLFSAWDSVGQFLVSAYDLALDRPSFYGAAKTLKKQGVPLGRELLELWEREAFRQFRELRHDSTHNFLPGHFGGTVTASSKPEKIVLHDGRHLMSKGSISIGVGKYVKSQRIVEINRGALGVFDETLCAAGLRTRNDKS
jgi:hypothetical protein